MMFLLISFLGDWKEGRKEREKEIDSLQIIFSG